MAKECDLDEMLAELENAFIFIVNNNLQNGEAAEHRKSDYGYVRDFEIIDGLFDEAIDEVDFVRKMKRCDPEYDGDDEYYYEQAHDFLESVWTKNLERGKWSRLSKVVECI